MSITYLVGINIFIKVNIKTIIAANIKSIRYGFNERNCVNIKSPRLIKISYIEKLQKIIFINPYIDIQNRNGQYIKHIYNYNYNIDDIFYVQRVLLNDVHNMGYFTCNGCIICYQTTMIFVCNLVIFCIIYKP